MSENKVKLEVVHDKDTGLTFFHFTWMEGDKIKSLMELANKPIPGTVNPVQVMAYDDKLDGMMGEARRAAIETMLTELSQGQTL